jgi:hypothetical protein
MHTIVAGTKVLRIKTVNFQEIKITKMQHHELH